MEKCEIAPAPPRSPADRTLAEIFVRPFGQVVIQRPLRHFDNALALAPGVVGEPGLEILTRLLTGFRSHQAMLRQYLGDRLYRNFENLVRGKNEPTPVTLSELACAFNSSPADLLGMAHGQKQGPLVPQYLQLLQMVEGFFSLLYGGVTAGFIPCPCCGKNMLDDTDAFWCRETRVRLAAPEYGFVERCLSTIIGGRLAKGLLVSRTEKPGGRCNSSLEPDPLDPHQYPIGNWLQTVRAAFSCSDNLGLERCIAALPPSRRPSSPVTQPRLNKWACGEDLIPLDVGKAMTQSLPNASDLRYGLLEARSIAFLHEFVSAAALGTDAPLPADVRLVVHERAVELMDRFRLILWRRNHDLRAATTNLRSAG